MLNSLVNATWLFAIPIIFICSLIFSIKLKFLQVTKIYNFKNCFKEHNNSEISPFQTFTMSLAGKVGVGSIAGIYIAIKVGGYGAIFWLWVSCILFSILGYAEGCLSQMYKQKHNKMTYGGAYYYIKYGLKQNRLSMIYAILIFFTYCFIFTSIQVKTVAISFRTSFNIPTIYTGMFIGFLIFIIVIKGSKGIAKFSEKLVPVMAIFYVVIGIIVILLNINDIPFIFNKIVKDAFQLKAIAPSVVTTILIGVRRGIFSSETGVGTSAILSGSVNSSNLTKQGYIQILTVYVTALIICTITAFIILIAHNDCQELLNVENSLKYFFGTSGSYFLSISLFLFGISTILSASFFGESVLFFINDKKSNNMAFKISLVIVCIISSVMDNSIVWGVADFFIGILTLINCTSMMMLIDDVVAVTKNSEK